MACISSSASSSSIQFLFKSISTVVIGGIAESGGFTAFPPSLSTTETTILYLAILVKIIMTRNINLLMINRATPSVSKESTSPYLVIPSGVNGM